MKWQAMAMVWWCVVLAGNVWAVGPALLCNVLGFLELARGK